ncbi:SDR family NAD(P)-dependent oxidoreductase [Gramella sp. BOM4]|nr:SDR family NAD(P)-dependent oxidoreductase [Christiangramia bathymodioli]
MRIAILGCGWLGLELGKRLREANHEVRGSVTRRDGLQDLRNAGIIPYLIKVFESGIQGDFTSFLSGVEILIIDIPPGLRKNPELDFVKKIQNLVPYIERCRVNRVIFTSSTSVYEDTEAMPTYTENSATDNSNNTAVQLHNAELVLLNNTNFHASIIRFGGLIGPERHPVKHLSGRKDIKNPKAPVNLVHQEDCINAILKLVDRKTDNSIWNLVYPEHPEKEIYYSKIATEKGLPTPQFDHSEASKGKKISSQKVRNELKFDFRHSI